MRVFASALIALLSIVDLVWSQGSAPPAAQAAELPTFRPVLIGQGPNALINRSDERDVVGKGQKDALIMFMCAVRKDGSVQWSATYRGTPDSDFLKQELQRTTSSGLNLFSGMAQALRDSIIRNWKARGLRWMAWWSSR